MAFFRVLLTLSFTATLATNVTADTSMWKITDGDNHLFLGGTMHVLSKDDYPLPSEFDEAYAAASEVVFETDITLLSDPGFQQKMMQKLTYQDGSTLQERLSPKTFSELKAWSDSVFIPIESINQFKPGMVLSVMTVVELQKMGIATAGVDSFFADKAAADGKSIGLLETVDQQLNFLANMGQDNPDQFISYTLRDLSELKNVINPLRDAWKTGDMQLMENLALTPMAQDYPAMLQNLIITRNSAWMPQIDTLLDTPAVELVLVGAAHLAGEHGLLAQARKAGYLIEQM